MTNHAAIQDHLTEAAGRLAAGDASGAIAIAETALIDTADVSDAIGLRALLVHAHLARGRFDRAEDIAADLHDAPRTPEVIGALFECALATAALQRARTILSAAEADGRLPAWRAAHGKARIALIDGDLPAAKAILAAAIEAAPENDILRRLLAEVMVASGNAADVRAVLANIGRRPVNPEPRAPVAELPVSPPSRAQS